jgi:hypothetical protein
LVARACGERIVNHPLRDIRVRSWSPNWARELAQVIEITNEVLPKLRELSVTATAEAGFEALSMTRSTVSSLAMLFHLATEGAFKSAITLAGPQGGILREEIGKLKELQEQASALKSRLRRIYQPTIFELDFCDNCIQRWTEANKAFFLFRGFKRAAARKMLSLHSSDKVEGDIGEDLSVLHQLKNLHCEVEKLRDIRTFYGKNWSGLETDTRESNRWIQLSDQISTLVRSIQSDSSNHSIGAQLVNFFSKLTAEKIGSSPIVNFLQLWKQAEAALTGLSELTRIESIPSSAAWIEELIAIVSRWESNLGRASAWIDWNCISEKGQEVGL